MKGLGSFLIGAVSVTEDGGNHRAVTVSGLRPTGFTLEGNDVTVHPFGGGGLPLDADGKCKPYIIRAASVWCLTNDRFARTFLGTMNAVDENNCPILCDPVTDQLIGCGSNKIVFPAGRGIYNDGCHNDLHINVQTGSGFGVPAGLFPGNFFAAVGCTVWWELP